VTQPADWHEHSIVSFGFGRYITPSFRTEFTLDYRTPRAIASGNKALADISKSALVAVGNTQTNIYSGQQDEETNYQNTTFLLSGFYDFNREGRLKPYVGAGIGLARHELQRAGTLTYTCYTGSQTTNPTSGCQVVPGTGSPATGGLATQYVATSNATTSGWGLAAQLSAGLSYDITPRTHWDTGYRVMWQSGRLGATSNEGLSTIRVQDRFDHEVRTGIRWDVW